jgi:hypothetical protein
VLTTTFREDEEGRSDRRRAVALWRTIWVSVSLSATVNGTWSLAVAQQWNWDRFWSLFSLAAVASLTN